MVIKVKKILLFVLCLLVVGCSKQANSKETIYLVESDPSKKTSYLTPLDKELEQGDKIDLDLFSVAQSFQNTVCDDKNIIISSSLEKSTDKEPSDKLAVYNPDKKLLEKLKLPLQNPDTITMDEKFVYNSYNSNGTCKVTRISRDPGVNETNAREVGKGFIDYINANGDLLYGHINSDDSKEKSSIIFIDKDSLDVKNKIELDKKSDGRYKSSLISGDNLILVGGNLSGKGMLVNIDLKDKKIVNVTELPYLAQAIFEDNGKLYIVSCEEESNPKSKSTILTYDMKSFKAEKLKDLDHRIVNAGKLSDGYVFLSLDEIWTYDKDFKLIKNKKLDNAFNLDLAVLK